MKETLIEIVQDILSDSDSDAVNSITATVESDQCARVVRTIFNQIIDGSDITYPKRIKELDATSIATPNIMTRPDGMYDIEWMKYNVKNATTDPNRYRTVRYMDPSDFVYLTASRASDDTTVDNITLSSGYELLVRNDIAPTYWTFLQGEDDIIFDSYDSALETNLQASKSLVYGRTKPTLALTDLAVPELPDHLFNALKSQSRALFFDLYKDGVTRKVDELDRRTQVRTQRHRHLTKMANVEKKTGQNFGRPSRRGSGRVPIGSRSTN